MKTPLQQLTTLIQQSNPELLTLGVGCEIKVFDVKFTVSYINNKDEIIAFFNSEKNINDYLYLKSKSFEIIGKPHTLVDVLKWYYEKEISVDKIINFQTYLLRLWNLNSIYLRDQSPELINFILNLKK